MALRGSLALNCCCRRVRVTDRDTKRLPELEVKLNGKDWPWKLEQRRGKKRKNKKKNKNKKKKAEEEEEREMSGERKRGGRQAFLLLTPPLLFFSLPPHQPQ